MDNVLKNHPTRYFEEIRFGKEGCQGYCTNSFQNKSCGRLDIHCNNLGNCSGEYVDYYKTKRAMYDITNRIDESNEAILDIY